MRAAQVVRQLAERGETLAFCESLSAGLASATIAQVPSSSAVLRGGLVTYATDLKVALAHVPQELVDEFGVVSAEVAAAMAKGTRLVCDTTWAVALTGVAGPDSQDGHPVGEVFIACAGPEGVVVIRAENDTSVRALCEVESADIKVLNGQRNEIREQAVECALQLLLDSI